MKDGSAAPGVAPYAALFHALAEPTRLVILDHLATGEHRVRDLVDHLGLAQSTVSAHLACLRDCGLVTSRAHGRASMFALAAPEELRLLLDRARQVLETTGAEVMLAEHLVGPAHGGERGADGGRGAAEQEAS